MVSMEAFSRADEYEHKIPDVIYTIGNIPGPGANIEDFDSEYCTGCQCQSNCTNCSCTNHSLNYKDGLLINEEVVGPIIECNDNCACDTNCGNRIVQRGPLDCLIVSDAGDKGLCLKSCKSIKKGQFICEYAGEVIGINEARNRIEHNKGNNSMNYVLIVSEYIGERKIVTCIDPKYFGNIGRYANHSCEPNTELIPVRIEGIVPHLSLFALRDIKVNEEITFNYAGNNTANTESGLSETICLCDSGNCLKYLPHDSI